MKQGRKPEYPGKTPGDELQKMPHTTVRRFKPQARLEPAQQHWWQVRKVDVVTVTPPVAPVAQLSPLHYFSYHQVDPSPDGQPHGPASAATSDGHPYTHNRTPITSVQRPAAPATNVQVYYMPQPAASASAAPQGFGPPAYDAPYPGLIQHQPVVITGLTTSANANAVVAMATSSEAAGRPTCVDDRDDSAVATGKPGPPVFLDWGQTRQRSQGQLNEVVSWNTAQASWFEVK